MGYRLMAWDGDFRTKDMFRASGREHANFSQKKAAHEAAERFMRTYPPKSEDARVILEKTSSRWGSTTEAKWGKGVGGWTKTSGDPRRRRPKLTRSQQAYVHRKIRILRREHPRWPRKQVISVAISYARRRGR